MQLLLKCYINTIKGDDDISIITNMTKTALAEVGNNYQKYCSYFDIYSEYCAMFISYIANKNGLINKCFYKTTGAGAVAREGVKLGYGNFYTKSQIKPKEGDCILFRYGGQYTDIYHSDHIGYVYKVDTNYVYTVEGNVDCSTSYWSYQNTKVSTKQYSKSNSNIYGYYRPNYIEEVDNITELKKGDTNIAVLAYKQILISLKAGGVITSSVDNNNIFGEGTEKATKEIQKISKISVDGIAGKETFEAINKLVRQYNFKDGYKSAINDVKKAIAKL